MPHTLDALQLDPVPASVGRARRMVRQRLLDVGRGDLCESAELVVSELVTNALLHAGAPITVRVRGTRRRPRIEVADKSIALPRLPEPRLTATDPAPVSSPTHEHGGGAVLTVPEVEVDLAAVSTHGRGMHLVISHSAAWGVDRSKDAKVVWFEPAASARPTAPIEIQVFEIGDLDRAVPEQREAAADHATTTEQSQERHRVCLLRTPVRTIVALRRHYDDLQREIRLIGLQYGAERLSIPHHLFVQAADPDLHRLRAVGTEQVQSSVAAGREFADLDYLITRRAAQDFSHTVDLLLEADAFCQDEQLLTLALSDRQRSVVTWYRDELLGQLDGGLPTPWAEMPLRRA